MRILDVFYNDILAGVLKEIAPGKKYEFKYDANYLNSDFPHISLNLPKREEPYISPFLFSFFVNMLPEGHNKEAICRHYKIDEEDDFSLLYVMADGDFIGAIELRTHHD